MSLYIIDRKELKTGYNLGNYNYEVAELNPDFSEPDNANLALLNIILENLKEAKVNDNC